VVDRRPREPVPDGRRGELVVSSLTSPALPLIRFCTRDVTAPLPGTARARRPMGGNTGRTDDMKIIRGVNVLPSPVGEAMLEDYHRRAGVRVPNMRVHAAAHAVIESQAALGDALPVRRAIQRLMDGGLDRHEAVHAVGSVLANTIFEISKDREVSQEAYNAEVEKLTV